MKERIQYFRPEIYRFMDEKFIDEFLQEGKLRLTSLKKMQTLENPRVDTHEGCFSQEIENCKMSVRIALQSNPIESAYILCSSLSPYASNPQRFPYCLKITNIEAFVNAVACSFEGCGYSVESIMNGPCNYAGRIEQFSVPQDEKDRQKIAKHVDKILKIPRGYALFQKSHDYMDEHEYRIVWSVKNDRIQDYVYLVNIENAGFCAEKIKVPSDDRCVRFARSRVFTMFSNKVKHGRNFFVKCCSRVKRIFGNLFYALRMSMVKGSKHVGE